MILIFVASAGLLKLRWQRCCQVRCLIVVDRLLLTNLQVGRVHMSYSCGRRAQLVIVFVIWRSVRATAPVGLDSILWGMNNGRWFQLPPNSIMERQALSSSWRI